MLLACVHDHGLTLFLRSGETRPSKTNNNPMLHPVNSREFLVGETKYTSLCLPFGESDSIAVLDSSPLHGI